MSYTPKNLYKDLAEAFFNKKFIVDGVQKPITFSSFIKEADFLGLFNKESDNDLGIFFVDDFSFSNEIPVRDIEYLFEDVATHSVDFIVNPANTFKMANIERKLNSQVFDVVDSIPQDWFMVTTNVTAEMVQDFNIVFSLDLTISRVK